MTTKNTPDNPDAPLTVGAQVELGFSDLLANGQAVGRTGGMVVFCFGPLPQERARVRITTLKQRYSVAELLAITRPSPFRAQPFCPVFGICGGCQVQHLSYPAQLGWKRDVVKNALERIGGLSGVQVRDPVGMINPRQYRNKMSLVVGNGRFLGFYKQRSHDLVPIEGCPIVLPALNAHIERLNADLRQPRYAPAFAQTRHIVERTARATEQTVVTFTTAQPSAELAQHAEPLMQSLPGAVGLTNSFDLSSQNAIVGRKHRVLAGEPQIEEAIDGVRYRVSAGSFFQVNVEIVGRIFEFMRAGLTAPRSIVDLYCGAGTFSLYFAKMGSRVLGVEESPHAIEEANQNAALNRLGGSARFLCGRVEELVRRSEVRTAMAQANIVFMDPPRKGSDEVTLQAVAQSGVPNIWYLSCDPATLARDLKFLAAKGYRLGVVQPFDMFPQTGHIETLVTLYRQSAMAEQIVAQAFKDAAAPTWPADQFSQEEYPEFVIR